MSAKTIRLSGWKAVLALIFLAGGWVLWQAHARTQIDTQGRARMERWVQAEVIRPLLKDTTQSLAEQGAALEQASSVKIRSLTIHGPTNHAVVRVELAPSPALKPGTKMVRYYRVRYSSISGWTPAGPTTALAWYLAAF